MYNRQEISLALRPKEIRVRISFSLFEIRFIVDAVQCCCKCVYTIRILSSSFAQWSVLTIKRLIIYGMRNYKEMST